MSRERAVIHLNVADFAVAVERVVDRSLCRWPVVVAPPAASRSVVYDMSDEAYGDGVRKNMPLRQAQQLCRRARVLPPRPDLYRRAMNALVSEARGYSPRLEHGAEDGHLFLDVTGTYRLHGAAPDVGWRLRKQVRNRLRIDPIWSLATNKLVAKVASRLVKPAGEYIVGGGEEASFLAPLPVLLLPGLAEQEVRRLLQFNIDRIGQLAALSRGQLQSVFGCRSEVLFQLSRGVDDDEVRADGERSSAIEREWVFADDVCDHRLLAGVVAGLAVRIGMELRAARLVACRLVLQVCYTDGVRVARQVCRKNGIADDFLLRRLAGQALERACRRRTRVRSCRLLCDRLRRQSPQLRLFADPPGPGEKRERLGQALAGVRNRFGVDALRFGSQSSLA